MAVTFTGAGTAGAASGASPQAVTTATACAVGDYLVVLMAYNNSAGSGNSDPITGTFSLSPATGAVGASVSAQTGLNDPGAVNDGLCIRCVAYPVTTTIPTSTVVNVTWSAGTVVVRAVAFMKVSSAGVTSYRTNSGATGTNSVNLANATAFVTPSVNNTEGVLCWTAEENGIAITGDADTTNGTWGSIYGTFTGTGITGMAAYLQGKVVTATATQTFNPTGNATLSDWITGCLIFFESTLLVVQNAAHAHAADAVLVTPGLEVQGAAHATTSDNVTITEVSAGGADTVTQEGFRWRNDDGSETSATWKAAQDTNTSLALDTPVRLRVLLDAAGDPDPALYTLYHKKTTDSTWVPVPVGAGSGSLGGSAPSLQTYHTFTGSNGAAWPAPWTTVNGTIQSNRGRLAPGASGYATARAHTTGLDIADVRLTGTFRINTLSEQFPAIGVRHNGSWTGGLVTAGLILYIDVGANGFILQTVAGGTDLESSSTAAITWATNTDYRFTIEVIEGSGVTYGRAKVWAANAGAEPPANPAVDGGGAGWMIDTSFTHASRPVSGGISAVIVSGASDATSYIEVDDLIIQNLDDNRLRVLAIGDSITAGPYNHPDYPSVATWRKYFFDDHEATCSLQMVGSNWSVGTFNAAFTTAGTYAGLGTWDHDHHAHNSWTTDHVLVDVGDDATNYQPDVAIIYIGLNDLLNSETAAATAAKVGDIIDAIRAAKADVRFVLCQIAPSPAEPVAGSVTAFNSALATLASTESTPTSPIQLADCNTGFNTAWLYEEIPGGVTPDDKIHFTDAGDHFVADQISAAFDLVIAGASNPVYVATSANITAGGQATTFQLTAPSGKTTADFVVGRMWDDENGDDEIDLGEVTTPTLAVVQEGFRWRNDDGSETGATWLAAQDTNASLELGRTARLRVLLDATGDPDPVAYTLRYKKTTDSTWLAVPVGTGGGSPVYIATSTNITAGGQPTTAQLTAPSGKTTAAFSTGRMWDDENGTDTVDIGVAGPTYIIADDFTGTNGSAWNASIWQYQRDGTSIQSNAGQLLGAASAHPLGLTATAVTDFELLVKGIWNTLGGSRFPEIGYRIGTNLSAGTPGDGYALQLSDGGGGTATLYRINSYATVANVAATSLNVNGSFWIRVRVVGTNHKIRWWVDGAGEPGTWQIDATDATYSTGRVMLANWNASVVTWDNLTVEAI